MIVSVILGVLFIIRPDVVLPCISLLVGSAVIIMGLTAIISYLRDKSSSFTLGLGVFSVILGIIICASLDAVVKFFVIFIGLYLLAAGIFNIITAIKIIAVSVFFGWVTLFLSIATSVMGVVCITQSSEVTNAVVQLVGISMIVYAVLDLVAFIQVKRLSKKVRDTVDIALADDEIETTGSVSDED